MKTTIYLEDLWFAVEFEVHSHHVEYLVYRINAMGDDGYFFYSKIDDGDVTDLDIAELSARGLVKWDGCSNWDFGDDNGVMMHFCERVQIEQFNAVLLKCYDMTKDLLPTWDN
jgi:hypothetical protein